MQENTKIADRSPSLIPNQGRNPLRNLAAEFGSLASLIAFNDLEIRIDLNRKKLTNLTMRPIMGSYQSATNSLGGALPVCLSGIGIHPRVQASSRRHYYHKQHDEVIGPIHSRRQQSVRKQDVSSTQETTDESDRLDQITLNEVRLQHGILRERPRHGLFLQMADLDRRRETIRMHRSNRGIVNSMDEQRTFLERRSNRMHNVLTAMMQDPSFQYDFVTYLQRRICAKAA